MKRSMEHLKKIIGSCEIMLYGELISKERLLQEYEDFLCEMLWAEKRNTGVLLHTGSPCFDAITLLFAAISNWIRNTMTPEELVYSLFEGDTVVYQGKRRIFRGIDEMGTKKLVKLESHRQDHGYAMVDTDYVPEIKWEKISPYYGESARMDGRGIRNHKKKHKKFLAEVLGISQEQIPEITNTSTVIVMPREKANNIVNGLVIKYGDSDSISLLELATASYYTESDEYPYKGNHGHAEPILKFTGKISVARRMIVRPEENKIIGFCVLGNEFLVSGKTELPDLLNRKALDYVLVSTHIDSENMNWVLDEADNVSLFACTKDFLLDHSLPVLIKSPLTEELEKQVNHIIDHEIRPVEIVSNQTWEQYSQAKRNLGILRTSDALGENKDYFIIQAHALMKLLLTAIFPISYMENMITEKIIDIDSPQSRLDRLIDIAETFPSGLRERAKSVIDLLETLYIESIEANKKEEEIRRLLESGNYEKAAIVVPKAYYRDILLRREWMARVQNTCTITVVTANHFDNNLLFDCIVTAGIVEGHKFSSFKCKAAPVIIPIIYDFEMGLYRYKATCALQAERQYNKMSFVPVEDSEFAELTVADNVPNDIVAASTEDEQLDEYVRKMNEIALVHSIDRYRGEAGGILADIAVIARFENGQVAFFSKAYTPYVFNETSQSVAEIELKELMRGDAVIFTQNNNETKDIVDAVLTDLVNNQKLDEEKREAYRKSRHWKRALREYAERTGATYSSISAAFTELGTDKGSGAIRDWMDPDSHTVGPLDADSYYIVALLTDDVEMGEDPQSYCDACSLVRKIRRKILKQIGLAVIGSFSGTQENDDPLFGAVPEKIDSLAQILKIQSVVEIEGHTMPSAMANKPLNIREE